MTLYSLKYCAVQSACIDLGMVIPAGFVAVTAFLFQLAHGNEVVASFKFALFAFMLMQVALWLLGTLAGLRSAHRRCREVGVTFDELGRLSFREMKRVQTERGI